MSTSKQIKIEQRIALQQQAVVLELQSLAKDIERAERTINSLKEDLDAVNVKHAARKTTQDDIHYLEDLLACAKKKLIWERHIASLQKRTPDLMQRVETLVNHPQSSPNEETRQALLQSLHNVQVAMQRLQGARIGDGGNGQAEPGTVANGNLGA